MEKCAPSCASVDHLAGVTVSHLMLDPHMGLHLLFSQHWRLTTRFRELASAGKKPLLAFSAGAVMNVIIGFVLSAIVFAAHWENLTR